MFPYRNKRVRKTLLKNKVFLKGALWSLFVPVSFAGKIKSKPNRQELVPIWT